MYRNKAVLGALAVACASVTLAACSSSSNAAGGGSSASPPGGSASVAGKSLLAQAQTSAQAATANPSGLTITTPLTKKPPTGKLIVSIQNANDVSAVENAAAQQAAKALGWTLKVVTEGSGVEDPIHAFETAISMHPAAI